ncbi:MAG: hypothetical protein B7W97_00310, partial [Mycobacterium sp. 20-66-4]
MAAQATDQGRDVLALTSSQWDITDPAAAESIIKSGDVVINCAAWTRVDAAEEHERDATRINGDAVGLVAREAGVSATTVSHALNGRGQVDGSGRHLAPLSKNLVKLAAVGKVLPLRLAPRAKVLPDLEQPDRAQVLAVAPQHLGVHAAAVVAHRDDDALTALARREPHRAA